MTKQLDQQYLKVCGCEKGHAPVKLRSISVALRIPREIPVGFSFFILLAILFLLLASKSFAGTLVQESEQAVADKANEAVAEAPASEAAEPAEEVVIPMTEARTEGTVSGVSNLGLAIEYAVDMKDGGAAKEIWLNFGEKVEYRGFQQDPPGIVIGDKVRAVYDESADNHRYIKEVVLIQKMPEAPAETPEAEDAS